LRSLRACVLILSVCATDNDQTMLRARITQYTRTDEQKRAMRADDVDMAVQLRLNEMRFVFLNAWLNRVLCWATPFQQTMAAAQSQATAQLGDQATDAMRSIQAAPPKMRLDIDLNAPIVIVPITSESDEALLIDFGACRARANGLIILLHYRPSHAQQLIHGATVDDG
jgi:hypothetical protein